jgi:oxygen-independent coproporphyrinogen-3 oxidase
VSAGESPAQSREILTERERRLERILLTSRLADGCLLAELGPAGLGAAKAAVADGLADPAAHEAGRVVLTRQGRLLADLVVRGLTD